MTQMGSSSDLRKQMMYEIFRNVDDTANCMEGGFNLR